MIYGSDKYAGSPENVAAKKLFDAAGVAYEAYEATGRSITLDL